MARKAAAKKRPNIVSVHLSPSAKTKLDQVCEQRGMTIKSLLGRLIEWFVELDKTEQSLVLGQIERDDIVGIADLIAQRQNGAPLGRGRGSRRRLAE